MQFEYLRGAICAWRPPARPRTALVGLLLAAAVVLAAPGRTEAGYASIVMDAETGEVLHAVNADTRNYPASLTKMMTLYMVFEALKAHRLYPNTRLPVSRRAQGMTPSKLGLRAGETIAVEDAILALVTKSANDAAVVVAEALGGSEYKFALQMTEKARALGMRRTRFRNASGLPNRGQLSTARDMATLARALIEDFPQYYPYFATERFAYAEAVYDNHNNLLADYRGTDGIKTGYIRASGFNLVASVERRGRRLIGVVFGGRTARSRDRHMKTLLNRAFAQLERRRQWETVAPPPPKPALGARVAAAPAPAAPSAKPDPVAAAPRAVDPPAPARAKPDLVAVAPRAADAPEPAGPKPAAVIAAAEAARAARRGDWAVQVGAFRRFAQARLAATQAAEHAPGLLLHTEVSISRVQGRRGPLYRARLIGLSEARAEQACQRLEAVRLDCLVIKPRGGVEVALNSDGRVGPAN